MVTKGGFRTIITSGRFRAYLIGGTNSKQNWEFQLERKTFRARASMLLKRAYFAFAVKEDKEIYVVGGRGDLQAQNYYHFIRSQCTMECYNTLANNWSLIKCKLNEGRYYASACIVGKWVYVFGGFRTKKLHGQYAV
jgi:N-acetylneuraminic acid mutarotase